MAHAAIVGRSARVRVRLLEAAGRGGGDCWPVRDSASHWLPDGYVIIIVVRDFARLCLGAFRDSVARLQSCLLLWLRLKFLTQKCGELE